MVLKSYLQSFFNLIFPKTCVACSNSLAGNEEHVCTVCLSNLPQTNFWKQADNPIAKTFWGRVSIEAAASFLFFEKDSPLQHMLYHLKYQGRSEIGVILGKLFGAKLENSEFDQIDAIVPVPLHKKRLKNRGYNQSEMIAQGLSHILKKPLFTKTVIRHKATRSQTSKARFDRWLNVKGVFKVTDPESITNKHLLVVDDVITTGATTESFVQELIKVPGVKVSVVSIASA